MDFKEEIYEIAFGDNAINRDFDELEVIERIQSYSDGSNPILIEDAWCETEQLNAFLTELSDACLLYTSPSPRDSCASRMPSSA